MSATARMPTYQRSYVPCLGMFDGRPLAKTFNWYLVPDPERKHRQNDWVGGMVSTNLSLPLFLAMGRLTKSMLQGWDLENRGSPSIPYMTQLV